MEKILLQCDMGEYLLRVYENIERVKENYDKIIEDATKSLSPG